MRTIRVVRHDAGGDHHMPVISRAGLKGRRTRVKFHSRAPMTYFMTPSFVKFVFADSQSSRLLFPVVDYVPAVLARLLAAFHCKPHEMMLKINVSYP